MTAPAVAQLLATDIARATERQMLGAVALAEVLAARGWVNPGYDAAAQEAQYFQVTMYLSSLAETCVGCGIPIATGEQCRVHVKLRTGERLYECARCAVRNGRPGFPVPDVDAERSAS
jgi:hypothetical protein